MEREEGELADSEGEHETSVDAADGRLVREDDLRRLRRAAREAHEEQPDERRFQDDEARRQHLQRAPLVVGLEVHCVGAAREVEVVAL